LDRGGLPQLAAGDRRAEATWIVDRLEKLGLAERRALPRDRRVKLVMLTQKGQRAKAQLETELHEPPLEFSALDRRDREALNRILAKLAPRREWPEP
jgi:DNA-binding MarR family transcriptional regulator